MQTFITSNDLASPLNICAETAQHLDDKRLSNQRTECKVIYEALQGNKAYSFHPATVMWRGHECALALYGFTMCQEWRYREHNDIMQGYFRERFGPNQHSVRWPWWFGDPNMVQTHRSKLLHKEMLHYMNQGFATSAGERGNIARAYRLPYIWPDPEVEWLFRISVAEYKRKDEWEVPDYWYVNSDREVTFA